MTHAHGSGVPENGPILIAAERLDFARRAAGLTQRELAERAEVSPGHMSRILRGQSGVWPDTMARILLVFGNRITFGELCEKQEGPSGYPEGPS